MIADEAGKGPFMAFLKSSNKHDTGAALFGETLTLRAPKISDFDQWVDLRLASEPFLRPFEPSWSASELTRRSFRKRLDFYKRSSRDGTGYSFFLKSRQNEQLLGGLTLSNIRYGVISSASLGYWIGQPYARQGHMSEAVQILLPFAFKLLHLHRLEAACLPQNDASVALLQKNGFKQEGIARKYLQINGVWQDHLLFALLEDDYYT